MPSGKTFAKGDREPSPVSSHEAGLDYGSISGSAMDEKIALIALFSTPVIKGFGAGWFVGEIYNDFHDMTRPNDIFMAGLRLAKDKGWTYYD